MTSSRRRVGLASKAIPLDATEVRSREQASCAAERRCRGQQRYEASHNRCVQPECKAFFTSLDADAGVCRYVSSFRVVLAIFCGVFGLLELLLHEAQHRLPMLSTAAGPEGRWWRLLTRWVAPHANSPREPNRERERNGEHDGERDGERVGERDGGGDGPPL